MCAGLLTSIIAIHLVTVIGRYLDPLEEPATNYYARKDVLQRQGRISGVEASDLAFASDQELRKLRS